MTRYHPQSRSVGREPPLLHGTLGIEPGIDDPALSIAATPGYRAAAEYGSDDATAAARQVVTEIAGKGGDERHQRRDYVAPQGRT